jgi:TolA protein
MVVIPLKTKERYTTYHVTLVGPLQTPRLQKIPLTKKRYVKSIPRKTTARTTPEADMSIEEVAKEIERIRAITELAKRHKKKKTEPREIEIAREKVTTRPPHGAGVGEPTEEGISYYYQIISQKIWQHWFYSDVHASGLEVIISIKIDKQGRVVSKEIEKFSGDVLFDRSALMAIKKASPFPPPPKEMEIGIRFYL